MKQNISLNYDSEYIHMRTQSSCIQNEDKIARWWKDNCLNDMAERLQPVCEANNGRDEGKKSSSNVSLDGRKSCFNMAKCVTQRDYTKSTFKTCWYIDFLLLIKRHFKSILGSMVFYHTVGWGVSEGKKTHTIFLENQFFQGKDRTIYT